MKAFTPLCRVWHQQVKDFFHGLHGHQSKTLAMFVLGAIKAESIVLARVAEVLLAESEAKAPSIERRLERFLSRPLNSCKMRFRATGTPALQRILVDIAQHEGARHLNSFHPICHAF